jgi:hypothetical protein
LAAALAVVALAACNDAKSPAPSVVYEEALPALAESLEAVPAVPAPESGEPPARFAPLADGGVYLHDPSAPLPEASAGAEPAADPAMEPAADPADDPAGEAGPGAPAIDQPEPGSPEIGSPAIEPPEPGSPQPGSPAIGQPEPGSPEPEHLSPKLGN